MTSGVTMATMVTIAVTMVLVLLSTPTLGFTTTITQSNFPNVVGLQRTADRNFALSAKDTIFSLNDDDDEEIEAVDSDDIEDIVKSLMIEENAEAASDAAETSSKKKIGDPLREDNGVRPSIHPTTINAIAEALKARATQSLKSDASKDEDEMMHFRVTDTVEPLMVMVTAGQFASDAIQKRQESSEEDGMLLTQGEEQTLAGRVMGVIMRLDDLEDELADRTSGVSWVGQYDEWGSFGVLEGETSENDDKLEAVHAKILDDPLFCMNRAECLLAIFLKNVEIPQLEKLKETVPDGSKIDFLDEDRREVVLGSE